MLVFSAAYFTKHNILQVPPCCCKWQNFILFDDWIIFHYISYLLIHLSVDRHYHILAIADNAAVNIVVHVSFQISVFIFFGYIPRSGIGDHIIVLCLVFWGTSILFSIVAVPIYIPTNSVAVFHFPHTLSSIFICRLFNDGHSDWCEVVRHCSFDLHF